MKPTIAIEGLSKAFVGHRRRRQPLYRELASLRATSNRQDDVKALDGIDLNLSGPASIALVGPNGAGKSTLLRIIAGIYRKYEGEVLVSGRLACFFGAKAGAAPSLSVLENVRLQAAFNGLTREQTRVGMDDILEFAELEDHRESRVEHLSFGMRQRLFFAITLQTMRLGIVQIYLFDEWLAGADARFREKVEDELTEMGADGRLVIYASHDIPRLRRMCDSALFLRHGRMEMVGETDEVLDRYLEVCGGRE